MPNQEESKAKATETPSAHPYTDIETGVGVEANPDSGPQSFLRV